MKRLIKTLVCENGELFVITRGLRIPLAKCEAEIKLYEYSVDVPVLGRGLVITRREVALLITFKHRPKCATDEKFINSISRIEFRGDILQPDGAVECVYFDNCLLDGDLDLTDAGTCQFELRCPQEMLNRLRII
jgi:hypothetical protein